MIVLVVAVVWRVQDPVDYLQLISDAALFVSRRADFSAKVFMVIYDTFYCTLIHFLALLPETRSVKSCYYCRQSVTCYGTGWAFELGESPNRASVLHFHGEGTLHYSLLLPRATHCTLPTLSNIKTHNRRLERYL